MIDSLRDILKKAQSLQSLVSDRPYVKPTALAPPSAIPLPTFPFPDQLLASIDSLQLPFSVSQEVKAKISEKLCMGRSSFLQSYRQTCQGLLMTSCNEDTLKRICRLYESIYQDQFLPKMKLLVSRIPCSSFPPSHLENKRISFNPRYTPMLQKYFELNAYPSAQDRQTLAEKSFMTPRQIEVWFQNHRRRAKKEGKVLPRLESWLSPFQIAPETFEVPLPSAHLTDTSGSSEEESENSEYYSPPARDPSILDQGKAPSHAFPTPYSPLCKGDPFSNAPSVFRFPLSLWMRKPAARLRQNPTKIDMEGFIASFAAMNIRDPVQRKTVIFRKSSVGAWYSSRVTVPVRAPHPSLMRRAPQKSADSRSIAPLPFSSNPRAFLNATNDALSTSFPSSTQLPISPFRASKISSSPRSRVSSSSSSAPSLGPSTPPLSPISSPAIAPFTNDDFGTLYDLLDLRSSPYGTYNFDCSPHVSCDLNQFLNFPQPIQLLAH